MKKIYWRPSKVPRRILIIIAALAVVAITAVEVLKLKVKQPYYDQKIQAARNMKYGMEVLKKYRLKRFGPVDPDADPANSGLIGVAESPITSKWGHLPAKQTTINPNWAAVMVEMLKKAGAEEGEVVAMGFSGSFPALNLAAYTAAEALNLKPVVISSVTASTWGANMPEFTWLDMERLLFQNGIISRRSVIASVGGLDDKAVHISKKGLRLIESAIARNKTNILEAKTFKENINERIAIYQSFSEGKRIAAYINVGGGTVSVGTKVGKKLFNPGLNRKPLRANMKKVDSVMTRFAQEGVPLIHMVFIDRLAERYGLPTSPTMMQEVGECEIFVHYEYNYYLVVACLIGLLFISYLFLRKDIGYRIFGSSRAAQAPKHPEPMV